jgi:hypothetical protein
VVRHQLAVPLPVTLQRLLQKKRFIFDPFLRAFHGITGLRMRSVAQTRCNGSAMRSFRIVLKRLLHRRQRFMAIAPAITVLGAPVQCVVLQRRLVDEDKFLERRGREELGVAPWVDVNFAFVATSPNGTKMENLPEYRSAETRPNRRNVAPRKVKILDQVPQIHSEARDVVASLGLVGHAMAA